MIDRDIQKVSRYPVKIIDPGLESINIQVDIEWLNLAGATLARILPDTHPLRALTHLRQSWQFWPHYVRCELLRGKQR
jgi:hypothetical protein